MAIHGLRANHWQLGLINKDMDTHTHQTAGRNGFHSSSMGTREHLNGLWVTRCKLKRESTQQRNATSYTDRTQRMEGAVGSHTSQKVGGGGGGGLY